MIYSATPINTNGLVKEGAQQLYDNHLYQTQPQNGQHAQSQPANTQNTKVYCDACIIQFYHRSNTFLSNLDMSCKQHQNKSPSALAVRCSETINNFNNSLMQMEKDLQNFAVDCQSNCLERNLHITIKQEMDLQKKTLYNIQNLQPNNFQGNTPSIEIGFYPNLIQYSNPGINYSNQFNQSSHQMQPQQVKQPESQYNNQILGQNHKDFNNSQNQLNLPRKQQSVLPQQQQLNQPDRNSFNQNFVQGYQQINPLSKEHNTLQVSSPIYFPTLSTNQINFAEQINNKINYSSYPTLPDINNPQQNFYNIIYSSDIQKTYDLQPLKQENLSNQIDFSSDSNSSVSLSHTTPDSLDQYQQNLNINDNKVLNQNMREKQLSKQLKYQITENQRNKQVIPVSDPKTMTITPEEKLSGDFDNKKQVNKQSIMKKANQKIKHAAKSQKQFGIIIRDAKNQVEQVNIHYVDNNFIHEYQDDDEMKIILDHQYQQEIHKKRKDYNKKMQDETTVTLVSRKQQQAQQKSNQQAVVVKHKEIDKKKFDRHKKQQEFLLSSGWCPQSQQLLFEWNNTPLKQISLSSDKIVNEFVNVASYVNILGKNRIMIISQNVHSLKYQINLIDLQENRVICKNQLGQNFQLYPFEPAKLNVQTVKINERISCIYLMGGSYFKIIKNSSLKNVKRVKQYCIQQILPINKGRKLVALSLNGLINIYSTTNDRFHLVQSMKIKRDSPFSISYVNYFDVDAENSLIYCCVLSSRSQFIQIFNIFTGEIVYSQDIHILQQNYGYNITNMKIFQNHLYIELQYQQDGHHHSDQHVQFKVQAYKIDNQSHHLNEFKTYSHSNILKSTISSKQFFLYNSQKSCIIGFEKLNSKKEKHFLSSPDQVCLPDINQNNNQGLAQNIEYSYQQQQNQQVTTFRDDEMCQKVFKLNIKQTSPKYRPIFTHIFKEIPHDHQQSVKKNVTHTLFDTFPSFNSNTNHANNNISSSMPNSDMVLTLFDQNKNVYKIFQDS